jgi:hypothetical protein
MPWPSALSSGNYDSLRGTTSQPSLYRGGQYLSVCPNTTVFAARVNGTPTDSSYGLINYDTVTSGSIGAVSIGMTILIAHTNDRRAAFFTGRVRGTTASVIYLNETSAPITDNDYVFIVDDYRIKDKLPRELLGLQYKDYDSSVNLLNPVIVGLQTAYAGYVNSSGKLRIAFDVSASFSAQSGATITTYAWSVPGSAAYIVGNSASAAPTIDFAESAGDWCSVTLTDSNSRVTVRHFIVFPHGDTYPPLLYVEKTRIDGSVDNGWNATVEVFGGVDTMLDNTLCVLWDEEWYNNTKTSLLNAVKFVGRFRQESLEAHIDPINFAVLSCKFTLEGPAAQLARTEMAKVALRYVTSAPTIWDEITNMTVWRAVCYLLAEHSTFLTLHALQFDSTDDTYLAQLLGVQGGDSFQAINDITDSINALLEFTPQGEARIGRKAWYLDVGSDRNSLTTVGAWDNRDYVGDVVIERDPVNTLAKVIGSGGAFQSAAGYVDSWLAQSPGVAQDQGTEEITLAGQILEADTGVLAQLDLRDRVGHRAAEHNDQEVLSCTHPDGYNWLVPSVRAWYTWSLASTENSRGITYDTSIRWWLKSITIDADNTTGTKSVSATYIRETIGVRGQRLDPVAPEVIEPAQDFIPTFDPFPALPEIPDYILDINPAEEDLLPVTAPDLLLNPPKNGNTVAIWTADQMWLTLEFLAKTKARYRDITPTDLGGYTIVAFLFNQNNRGAYLLAYDSGDDVSAVWYTSDVFATVPDWEQGEPTSGEYTVIRQITPAVIAIYSPDAPFSGTLTALEGRGDVTVTQTGAATWHIDASIANVLGHYMAFLSFQQAGADQCFTIDIANMTGWTNSDFDVTNNGAINTSPGPCSAVPHSFPDGLAAGNGWQAYYYAQNYDADTNFILDIRSSTAWSCDITLSDISTVDQAGVAFSSNNGAFFPTTAAAGTPLSVGGFDASRTGGVTIAAADEQAYKATSAGGAYATLGAGGAVAGADPVTLIVPYYALGSTATKNYPDTTPDYLIGATPQVSSEGLWKVTGAGSRTAITPAAGATAIGPNLLAIWKGTKIAVVMLVSGTRKLYTSLNTGTAWTFRSNMSANCNFIRGRRGDAQGMQLWVADGATLKFSKDWGATLTSKTTPNSSDVLKGVDIYG